MSADDLAAVREALRRLRLPQFESALPALDRLAERLEEAEDARRNDVQVELDRADAAEQSVRETKAKLQACEARVEELHREALSEERRACATEAREEALRHELAEAKGAIDGILSEAKAREAALREALGAIATLFPSLSHAGEIARAALAEKPESDEAQWRSGLWRNTR